MIFQEKIDKKYVFTVVLQRTFVDGFGELSCDLLSRSKACFRKKNLFFQIFDQKKNHNMTINRSTSPSNPIDFYISGKSSWRRFQTCLIEPSSSIGSQFYFRFEKNDGLQHHHREPHFDNKTVNNFTKISIFWFVSIEQMMTVSGSFHGPFQLDSKLRYD